MNPQISPLPNLAAEIKKLQPFDSPAREAHLNVIRTNAVLTAPIEKLFKAHNVSGAKYNILRILRGAMLNEKCGQHGLPSLDIADRLITRVPDITRLVDGLEADGLVVRTRCTADRRVVYVGITGIGMTLLETLDDPVLELHNQLLSHMTAEELTELSRLLVKARHKDS